MKAADVMVCAVISVRPSARVEEVASILLANRISAVPVIDEQDQLVGTRQRGRPHAAGRGRNRAEPFLVAGISDRQTGARRGIREIPFALVSPPEIALV